MERRGPRAEGRSSAEGRGLRAEGRGLSPGAQAARFRLCSPRTLLSSSWEITKGYWVVEQVAAQASTLLT